MLKRAIQDARAESKIKRALQTLLHPEMLGRAFQVLALAKNVDSGAPRLAGFKFAREPGSSLGLKNQINKEVQAAIRPDVSGGFQRTDLVNGIRRLGTVSINFSFPLKTR